MLIKNYLNLHYPFRSVLVILTIIGFNQQVLKKDKARALKIISISLSSNSEITLPEFYNYKYLRNVFCCPIIRL